MSQKHHRPPAVAAATHFRCAGSPLDGKRIPLGWGGLTLQGKALALVKVGYAPHWTAALGLLGQHAGAIGRARKAERGKRSEGEAAVKAEDDLKRRDRWWDR